jgi:hypothetical protein
MDDNASAARAREREQHAVERAALAEARAREAHDEANNAGTPELQERYEREAGLHERAAEMHRDAAVIQARHAEEHG